MSFHLFAKDIKSGLKRKIYSRKNNIEISVKKFEYLSNKYFSKVRQNTNLKIKFNEEDKDILLFIFRWYYQLWVEISGNTIEIYKSFPKKFKIIKEVNNKNHAHCNRIFKQGTKMYIKKDNYSVCNFTKGIPLSNLKDEDVFFQINYEYIIRDV